jgi:quinol monooxygenase YgiN
MYVRIISGSVKPGTIAEGVAIFEDSIGPATKEQPGFISTTLLVNESESKFTTISRWETEADMQASLAGGFLQAQIAKIGPLLTGEPTYEQYELVAEA